MEILQELIAAGRSYGEREPTLTLAFAGALAAVLGMAVWRARGQSWAGRGAQLGWGLLAVVMLVGTAGVLKRYLNRELAEFCRTHGRVSEANYNAVQAIWGPEQNQQELTVEFGYDEEVTERVEFEDPSKPALIKKKIEHRTVPGNPFESARHEVTVRQNPRKKGSAIYPGYETDCRFTYKLQYPGNRDVKAALRFPLPGGMMVCNELAVNLNGASVLGQLQVNNGALLLELPVTAGWGADLEIKFKSRGVAYWYFQVTEARVIRDFLLTLHLPDLPKEKLNYPEGCMTPTEITGTADGRGCDLTYRLGNAVSAKGMGIALSQPPQPGKTMNAVLSEASTAWTLLFAALVIGLTLAGARNAALICILMGVAVAFGYGLLGNFHDIAFGFWGSATIILLPLLLALGWGLQRIVPGCTGKLLALAPLVFGGLYPSLAGLDADRQALYLNVSAFALLALTAWLLARRPDTASTTAPA